MVEVHFINLEEIVQQSDEEEQTISEREELRRRLIQAGTSYRQKKELYDRILVDGLALEELTNEIVAENKKLTGREKDNQKLREKNENLSVEHKLEEIEEALRSKDDEIKKKFRTVVEKLNEIEEHLNNMKDEEDEEQDKKTESWWHRCATILWRGIKAAGLITNCVLLSVGIMTSIVPFCNSSNPDCNLWSIIFNMLEPYSQLQHIHPPDEVHKDERFLETPVGEIQTERYLHDNSLC
eukprot:superscaffoldBa00001712_g11721